MMLILTIFLLSGEVYATNKICQVPSIRTNQNIAIPVKEIDNVIQKVKNTVQDKKMKERGNTMISMQLSITEKILQEAEDNMMTIKSHTNHREQKTRQKRNIFTSIIGAASETEIQQEIIQRQMLKITEKNYREETKSILSDFMKDIAEEKNEIEMIGNGLNKTMNSILRVGIQSRKTREMQAIYQLATHLKEETDAIRMVVTQGNEEAITKMLRNYDKQSKDSRKKWRVKSYHSQNNKIDILLQATEYERKQCTVKEHQYKQCVKIEGVTLITKKNKENDRIKITEMETEAQNCNFTLPVTQENNILNENTELEISCLDTNYRETKYRIQRWESFSIPSKSTFCWSKEPNVKWKRKIKDIKKENIDIHYNKAIAIREHETKEEQTKMEIMHHKIAMNSLRKKIEKLSSMDNDEDETFHETYWADLIIIAIVMMAIGVIAAVIRKQSRKMQKELEQNNQRVKNLEKEEKATKDKLDKIHESHEMAQRLMRDIKTLKEDGTIDYIRSLQNGTFKLDHTGYIDDTFHEQELTSSTPKAQ